MKKLLLSIAIVSALGLTGCDNDAPSTEHIPTSTVLFSPADGDLSIPNDLLFSGTLDGTLNIPISEDEDQTTANPKVAMNALDGWSTTNPFTLAFDFETGVSLDEASASNSASVRIFETVMGGSTDPNYTACAEVPRGAACAVVGELTFDTDFVTKKSGDSLAIIPLKPLKAKTTYIVMLSNTLQDTKGKSISESLTYLFASADEDEFPLGEEGSSERGLQGVLNSYENAIVAAGADKDNIIYTMAMTTQSTVDVLATVKALTAQNVPAMVGDAMQGIPTIGVMDTGMSVADILAGKIPASLIPLYSTANFMQGSITLPYYLGVPSAENPKAPVNDWWKGLCDSGAMLAGLAAANPSAIPADPISESDATCMAISEAKELAYPGLRDLGIDTERNLTKFSPVPKAKGTGDNGTMDIVVQMTTPDVAVVNAVRLGLGLPANLVEPENGWPVVILQHGITSKKEDMLGLTGILSLYGLATVAINHPLHGDPDVFSGLLPGGSRGFDLNGDGVDEINASTVSATHYMNLASLLTTRDNLRQSTADLLGLRLGIKFLGGSHVEGNPIKVDNNNVHFLGHSLGAITGINFIALANTPLDPQVDPLFAVNTNSLAMPGVMVANFLMESGAFGDVIKSGLTYTASEDFQNYVAQVHQSETPPTSDELVGYYQDFYVLLTPEQQAELNGTFAQFAFAAQTVTDAGDPANYAAMMVATNTPTHLIEVVGNGSDNLSDQVIPNAISSTPIGGTKGAISLLVLPSISETTQDADSPVSGVVRYLFGHHSSILDPSANVVAPDPIMTGAATTEMQSQVANFFSSGGHLISIQEEDLVQ